MLNRSMRRQTRDAHDLSLCRHHSSCPPVKWRRKNRTKSSPPGAAYMLAIELRVDLCDRLRERYRRHIIVQKADYVLALKERKEFFELASLLLTTRL